MNEDAIKLKGKFRFELVGPDGTIKRVEESENLVVTSGRNHVASRLVGTAQAVMSHMAVGSSGTAPALGDTALGGELGRVALSGWSASTNVATATASFGAGVATGTLQEVGLFNASASGTMLCRSTYSSIVKGSADTLNVTYTVTAS
jgi:hypothetical protein